MDLDLLFLTRALVLCGHADKAVGVDVKSHFNLWHAARCWRNANKVEIAKQLVIRRHFALALEHADGDSILIVFCGRIYLALLRRDRRIAVDHAREHTAERFDTERQWRHIEQKHILDVALQHASLNGGAHCNDFVWVHTGVRFFTEETLHDIAHLWHAGHAADHHDFINAIGLDARIGQRLFARLKRTLDQIINQLFKVSARDGFHQMLRTILISGDERQVDFGCLRRRQFNLRLFSRFLQTLQRKLVLRQVNAFSLVEIGRQMLDEHAVEIFTAQERIAIGRFDFEHAIANFKDRDVKRTAAKVIDRDGFVFVLIHAVRKRSSRRLVNDTQHFKPCNQASILSGLTLGIVEIGWNGDNRLRDGFAQIGFRCFLHLLQNECRNLRWRIIFAAGLNPCIAGLTLDDAVRDEAHVLFGHGIIKAAADKALHCVNRAFWIGDSLTLGWLSDQTLAILGKGHNRWRRTRAFCIFDDLGLAAVHDRNAAVCRAQVDTNNFSHKNLTPKF